MATIRAGYRVDSGFRPTCTAAGVVHYEQDELGNPLGVPPDRLRELDRYPAFAVIWVTRLARHARRYGMDVQRIVFPQGAEVLAYDSDGGLLVFYKE